MVRLRAGTLAALSLVVALAGCGGSAEPSAEESALPRALASDLAATSEAIADALDGGDLCGAAQLADELDDAVEVAVAEGRVPAEFQGELEETAVELQNGVNCVEPSKEEGNDEEKDEKKDEEKDKDKGKGNDEEVTATVDTGEDED